MIHKQSLSVSNVLMNYIFFTEKHKLEQWEQQILGSKALTTGQVHHQTTYPFMVT